jgi:hypothetical protein
MFERFAATAFNPVPQSENEIHGDDVAQRFGFRGGLVPGVVISAYLFHPAASAWGLDWLERGWGRAVVKRPLYDGVAFDVESIGAGDACYDATLVDADGTRVAEARAELPAQAPAPPVRRGDPVARRGDGRPRVSRAILEELREKGMGAARSRFGEGVEITGYLRDPEAMAEVHRPSGGRFASAAFLLGVTNWALAANVYLPAWLHLQTEHQSFAAVPWESELVTELAVADLFERKGHEFVDLDLATYFADGRPVAQTRLRAIYRLRGA